MRHLPNGGELERDVGVEGGERRPLGDDVHVRGKASGGVDVDGDELEQ